MNGMNGPVATQHLTEIPKLLNNVVRGRIDARVSEAGSAVSHQSQPYSPVYADFHDQPHTPWLVQRVALGIGS